jgi:peptidoglycan-associated lipoprotein
MKLRKLSQALLLIGAMSTLAACSSLHRHNNADDEAAVNEANAKTAGLNGSEQFNGSTEEGAGGRTLSKRTYYFDFDKSDVRQEDRPAIESNASHLASNPGKKVIVQGHTDPRGSREYNVALGEHRAASVADILKANGVNPNQVRVVSYGAQRLAAPGHTEEDFQQDRRAILEDE